MTVSPAAHSVTVNGEPVSLTNREFDLLMFFSPTPTPCSPARNS